MTNPKQKHLRNITLYDQTKIAIHEPDWPSMTRGMYRPPRFIQVDKPEVFRITVRENKDGRMIVYGSHELDGGKTKHRGGEVIDAERAADLQQVISAIHTLALFLDAPSECVSQCLSGLRPQRLLDELVRWRNSLICEGPGYHAGPVRTKSFRAALSVVNSLIADREEENAPKVEQEFFEHIKAHAL